MRVYIGADHGGYAAKEQLKEQLRSEGYDVEDVGAHSLDEDDDYPVYGQAVAEAVVKDPDSRGIALCRSGHGMVIAANKVIFEMVVNVPGYIGHIHHSQLGTTQPWPP